MADDHAPIRSRIRAALEAGGCDICGEGASAEDAIRLALEHRPDVVLLDIHMPGNGIYAAREISRSLPLTPVVMLTMSRDDDDLFDSLRAGASGYLLKDTDPAALPGALRAVLAGEAAMPPELMMRVLGEFRAPTRRRFLRHTVAAGKLSARE
ncbi:MAG TPA: response regulator transcription factor, partial [Candidatus Nanopelagicales bacterium]|nr:response regulator transcription factor [Candidatus Nanopelagicales bacterium]